VTDAAVAVGLGVSLLLVELGRSVPAWLRVRRTQSVDGYSAVSQGILLGTAPAWLLVAVIEGAPWIFAATALWAALHVALVAEGFRVDPAFGLRALRVGGVSLATAGVAALVGATLFDSLGLALGLMVVAATAGYSLPALVAGMRSASTRGLSVIELGINVFEGVVYVLAGLGVVALVASSQGALSYVLFGAVAVVSNAPRLVRTSYRRVRGLDTPPVLSAADTLVV